MNCGRVRCGPLILMLLKMEEYRIGIGVGLISVVPVEENRVFCEEVVLNRVASSTFDICDSVEDGVSLCILILDLECHRSW